MPQYQGIWSLQSAAQLQSTQRWVTDPSFDYTTLLLQADNAPNGAQNNTFIDSSSNNFTITRNGNTTQGTFTPYSLQPGAWSNYFDGTGDYLRLSAAVNLSGNFTAEAFVYSDPTFGGQNQIFGSDLNTADGNKQFYIAPSTYKLTIYDGSSAYASSGAVPQNQWAHVAISRQGSTITFYINGVSSGTATVSATMSFRIVGGLVAGSGILEQFKGYISNARIVSGTAVYTANFTPSPIPLTAITNTSLLTCQSNRFVDNSTNAFAITVNGNTSVQAFSPFAPQYQWTAPVIGGSGYFDGTGDYLTVPDNANLRPPNGNFTYEIWWYPTSLSGTQEIFTKDYGVQIYFAGGVMNCALSSNNSTSYFINASFGAPTLNSWNHIAVVRSGNDYYGYLNGVRTLLGTSTSFPDTGTGAVSIGAFNTGTLPSFGYLSGARYTTGALYTASPAAIPTSPPTTTVSAGTVQLLVNFTNAGIYDGTMKNNLETVGNAQISTSVVKYGTGSMAFDGSGDYLVVGNMATNPNLALLAGDFTIEYWYYPLNTNIHATLNNLDDFNGNGSLWILMNGTFSGGSKVQFGYNTGSISNILFGTGTFATNQWYHIAITRQGSAMRCFINGIQEGATNTGIGSGSIQAFNRNLVIGATLSNTTYSAYNLNGYLDDFRLTKGIARYTANFTPPTVALPRQ